MTRILVGLAAGAFIATIAVLQLVWWREDA